MLQPKLFSRSIFMRLLAGLLFLASLSASAQKLTGTVKGEKGEPLKGVSVILKDGGGKMLSYAISSKSGGFSLNVPEGKHKEAMLELRSVSHATVKLPMGEFENGQTVIMKEAEFVLNEVKVKPRSIYQRGDTLDYLVNSFKQKSDRSIADVIARMPGLEVSESGGITYQGKAINKFYIEGMDLMGGKYAAASENIDADKVKKVQVMENHQPVRALKDVAFSDQAALNIVLDDGVKDLWQGDVTLAGGSPLQGGGDVLYDSRALAMLFSRKLQSLSMYKCNSTGKDIAREVQSLAPLDGSSGPDGGLLSGIGLGGTGLDERRTKFNDTHMAATNWLLRTPKGNDLRLQMTALFDKEKQRQQRQTTYLSVGDAAIVAEESDAAAYRSEYEGELMYKVNKDSLYLVNNLKGLVDFNRSTGHSFVNGEYKSLRVRPRRRFVADDLQFIRNLRNGRSFTLKSSLSYNHNPGTLLIYDGTSERLDISTFRWNASTAFGHRLGRFNVNYTAGFNLKKQKLEVWNSLNSTSDTYDEYLAYVTPSVHYVFGDFDFDFRLPLNWRYRSLNAEHKARFVAEPGLSVKYEPTARWKFYAYYSYSWRPYDALRSGAALVFTDHITVRGGSGRLEDASSHFASLSANYKDVIRSFFADFGLSYSGMLGMPMYSTRLDGIVLYDEAAGVSSNTDMFSVRASASKSFDWMGLLAKLSVRRSWNRYDIMVSGRAVPYESESGRVGLSISAKPMPWLLLDLSSSFSDSRQAQRGAKAGQGGTLRSFEHSLDVCVMPGRWVIEWGNELYHSNDKSVSTSFFSDISVSYKTRRYELGLELRNIFGKQMFERRYLTDAERVVTSCRLRPREIVAMFRFGI